MRQQSIIPKGQKNLQVIIWSEHIEAVWGQRLVDLRKQPIARSKSPDQYDVLPAVSTKRGKN